MKAYLILGNLFLILLLPSPFTAQAATDATQETLSLKAGGAGIAISAGPEDGSMQGGYAAVAVESGSTPFATAVMSYSRDGVVISEVVVPAAPPTESARLFVDFRTDVPSGSGAIDTNTGITLVNMGTRTAQISLLLRNLQGDLIPVASGTLQLGAKAHLSKFINQLDPDFVLPPFFPSVIGFGSLEISSDQPISIFALRMTINQRGEPLFTSIPIADLTSSLATSPLIFPQITDGGGYQTTFLLMNTSDTQESGTLYFIKDDGSPYGMHLNAGGDGAVSQFHYTVQAKAALRILTDGSPSETTTGWAQLVPAEGSAPMGMAILESLSDGILITESSVPSASPTTHARLFIDGSSNHETGLAVVAMGDRGATVTLQAYQSDGIAFAGGPASIQLPANGHRAAFANQLIPELPSGFTGILDLQSSTPFAALTLRALLNTRNDFLISTFPIADYCNPAPAPIVFPQITAGDGYQTEVIFLNTGNDANVTISWVGED
jgi:hypothetical protein